MARRFFIDESVKPASLYVIDGDSVVAEAHELERELPAETGTLSTDNIEKVIDDLRELEGSDEYDDEPEASISPGVDLKKLVDQVGGKKPRYCKLCGKPGHRKDTCPDGQKDAMSDETRERVEDSPEDQELVWDIRSKFLTQMKAPPVVCSELGITMGRFIEICKQYDIHR